MPDLFNKIEVWGEIRGIYSSGNVKNQMVKLMEETGELARAILKGDKELIKDSLGDSVVVLVSIAKMSGFNLEECIQSAYNEISSRTGKMENGDFKKTEANH